MWTESIKMLYAQVYLLVYSTLQVASLSGYMHVAAGDRRIDHAPHIKYYTVSKTYIANICMLIVKNMDLDQRF